MESRRSFIGKSILGAGAISFLSSFGLGKKSKTKITILHTNDVHSRIEPFPVGHPKYSDQGGMARRASVVSSIRAENDHVLLLDAGDIFQGTPYFNLYGGELEFRLMSIMEYDAATIGNHDFDNGLDGFNRVLPNAEFPFICSNYDFSDTILKGKTLPYKVIQKGDVRIGIIGVGIELKGLVPDHLYGKTRYLDPIEQANKYAKLLKQEKNCDLVICLSHLGYSYESDKISDLKLASSTRNIDLILGGHTHTFMKNAKEVENVDGEKLLINQVGWAGINLGRIDYVFKNRKLAEYRTHQAIQVSDLSSKV